MIKKKIRIKSPPLLFSKTQAVIARIERMLGKPFLAYWNSPGGSICGNDVNVLNEVLLRIGKSEELALFIKSDGGTGRASLRMIHLVRHFTRRLVAVVPLNCCSAATMLALGADEIHMGEMAYLSPVDTSLRHDLSPVDKDNDLVSVSQDELMRIIDAWRREGTRAGGNPFQALFQHVHPLVIGAVDRASSLSIQLCRDILSYHMKDRKKAGVISKKLNSAYPSHSYPITIREAKLIGLTVKPLDARLNSLLTELNELYSEMGQRAVTDFDEKNHHDNEILTIIEGRGIQLFYQVNKDWHYRTEERRWVSLNDESVWREMELVRGRVKSSVFHLR